MIAEIWDLHHANNLLNLFELISNSSKYLKNLAEGNVDEFKKF
jgi:hypothetical protein